MLSGNTIKKLGKKLRDGSAGIEEFSLLDAYRAEFEPLLLETCENIVCLLNCRTLNESQLLNIIWEMPVVQSLTSESSFMRDSSKC